MLDRRTQVAAEYDRTIGARNGARTTQVIESMAQGRWTAREASSAEDELPLLKAAVAAVQHGVAIARVEPDQRLPLIHVNPAFVARRERLAEELIGRDCRQFVGGPSDPRAWELLRSVLESGRPASATLSRMHAGGEPAWIELAVSPVLGPGGKTTHLVLTENDISERVQERGALTRLNRQLAQRSEELHLINESLGCVSAAISHDLRTPLAVIRGFSELAMSRRQAASPDDLATVQDCVRRVHENARRMDEMIDAMLQLAQAGIQPMERLPLDLGRIAREVTRSLQARFAPRQVTVHIDDSLKVRGDPTLLRSVMENLLSNAWKYTAVQPNPEVWVGRETDPDGAPGAFFVRDNGVGFDASRMRGGFQPFRRFHAASEFPGHGVGLASARQILARHGGSIWAESSPGQGACFYFSIPEGDAPPRRPEIERA